MNNEQVRFTSSVETDPDAVHRRLEAYRRIMAILESLPDFDRDTVVRSLQIDLFRPKASRPRPLETRDLGAAVVNAFPVADVDNG